MVYEVITPPVSLPVTRDEFKNLVSEAEDTAEVNAHIDHLLQTALERVQEDAQLQLMPATFKLHFDCFPDLVELRKPPIQSVTEITYIDSNGEEQTLDSADWQADTISYPGRILPSPGKCWPAIKYGQMNAVSVEFVAGYADANSVPGQAKEAIQLLAGYWYDIVDEKGSIGEAIQKQYERLIWSLKWGL